VAATTPAITTHGWRVTQLTYARSARSNVEGEAGAVAGDAGVAAAFFMVGSLDGAWR
jgi:hypothetical protein